MVGNVIKHKLYLLYNEQSSALQKLSTMAFKQQSSTEARIPVTLEAK